MKLATNRKVIKLRNRRASIEYVLKTVLNRADKLEGVIVLEITNKTQIQPFMMCYSTMTHANLVWSLKMAELKINDTLRGDRSEEPEDPKLIG
jgi:hypothetical protein